MNEYGLGLFFFGVWVGITGSMLWNEFVVWLKDRNGLD